jgi:predicted nucleic acid-binding protein
MIVAIADTHATIWYLFSDPRLGSAASAFIDDTLTRGDHIGVSAITIAEMVYLIEKGRIPATALNELHTATADPGAVLRHVPFDSKRRHEDDGSSTPGGSRSSRPRDWGYGAVLQRACTEP